MLKVVKHLLKYKFIFRPYFWAMIILTFAFNFIFPLIILGPLKFDASVLFDMGTLCYLYLMSYSFIGVFWILGIINFFILEVFKNGYVNALLELKYSKKQILSIFFWLVFLMSLVYLFQVFWQTLLLGLMYSDKGFSTLYSIGAVIYSLLLFAITFGATLLIRMIFKASHLIVGWIIIFFSAFTPVISAVLLNQSNPITISKFRETRPQLNYNGATSDILLADEGNLNEINPYEQNKYDNLIYFDLANQVKTALDIFGSINNFKKVKITHVSQEREFTYFKNFGSYGLAPADLSFVNQKYLPDQEFLRYFDNLNALDQSILNEEELLIIEKNINTIVENKPAIEFYFNDQKLVYDWDVIMPTQAWIYQNIIAYLIYNYSNKIISLDQEFLNQRKIIIELNQMGYEKITKAENKKEFFQEDTIDQWSKRIVLLDQKLDFNYLKEDYIYQIKSEEHQATWNLTFENNVWNMIYSSHGIADYMEDLDFYLNSQEDNIISQYFKYLNAAFYAQQLILQKNVSTISDLDKLSIYQNILVKQSNIYNYKPITGINAYDFDDQFLQLDYVDLYPKYPFLIFWIVISLVLVIGSLILVSRKDLL